MIATREQNVADKSIRHLNHKQQTKLYGVPAGVCYLERQKLLVI